MGFITISEKMSPSELKKLRNKQKKAKRKAEAEKASAQQAQQRKEAHNKSQKRGPGGEGDELDAPQKDELVPEKLERPKNPMEEAMKFLIPLQNLAKQDLDTHFAAFEIYYRKGKASCVFIVKYWKDKSRIILCHGP